MTRKEIKIIAMATSGQIVEYYNFMIFVLLVGVISNHFFVGSQYVRYMYLFFVFAIGNFARPIGGLIFGHFGDTIGRKKTFFFTLLVISISTFCMGLIPSYKVIGIAAPIIFILLRILQGISLGGELPGGISFVYEYMPKNKRTLGTAFLSSSVSAGMLLASGSASVLYMIFNNSQIVSFGWRIPFFVGGVLGIIICILRSKMSDTPVFEKLLINKQILQYPLKELFKSNLRNCILGIVIDLTAVVSIIFIITLPGILSTFLHLYKYKTIIHVNTFSVVLLIICVVLFAYIIEKFRLNIFLCNAIGCILVIGASYPLFMLLQTRNIYCLILTYIIIAILMSILYSTLFHILAKLFPAVVRYSGLGLVINISVIFSVSCTPLITTYLLKITGNLFSIAYLLMAVIIFPAVAGLILYFRPPDKQRLKQWGKEIRKLYHLEEHLKESSLSIVKDKSVMKELKVFANDEIRKLYELDKNFDDKYLSTEGKQNFIKKLNTFAEEIIKTGNAIETSLPKSNLKSSELSIDDIETVSSFTVDQQEELYKRCKFLLDNKSDDIAQLLSKYKKLFIECKGNQYYTSLYGRLLIKETKAINKQASFSVNEINKVIKRMPEYGKTK
jgi:MFS family permease